MKTETKTNTQTLRIKLELIEEMLGTKAANKDIFADYIASKCPDEDLRKQELENAEHREEAGTSIFHRENGEPVIYDYQIKGFFKDACGALRNADDTESKELKAYKTRIDGLVFVSPRIIKLKIPNGTAVGVCERPLRADGPMGPRVGLCRSETIPAGTIIEFEVRCLAESMQKFVREWLNYGQFRGLGQWRNSGKGRFVWSEAA